VRLFGMAVCHDPVAALVVATGRAPAGGRSGRPVIDGRSGALERFGATPIDRPAVGPFTARRPA
jgi:hypothetical protein